MLGCAQKRVGLRLEIVDGDPGERGKHASQKRAHIRLIARVVLGEELAASLGVEAAVHPVETTLHGEVRDRVELHTLLDRLDALGIEVVELRRTRAT